MKLFIVSEGPRDVGKSPRALVGNELSNVVEVPRRGAVTILTKRLVEEATGGRVGALEIETAMLPRLQRREEHRELRPSGLETKVQLAIAEGRVRGSEFVAVVMDRDGRQGASRLDSLKHGREALRAKGEPLAARTAVGVAIETVEAWLLSDSGALNSALAPEAPIEEQPDPESLYGTKDSDEHPKTRFESMIHRATRNQERAYDAVAELVNLKILRARCKQGFDRFAVEVQDALRA